MVTLHQVFVADLGLLLVTKYMKNVKSCGHRHVNIFKTISYSSYRIKCL